MAYNNRPHFFLQFKLENNVVEMQINHGVNSDQPNIRLHVINYKSMLIIFFPPSFQTLCTRKAMTRGDNKTTLALNYWHETSTFNIYRELTIATSFKYKINLITGHTRFQTCKTSSLLLPATFSSCSSKFNPVYKCRGLASISSRPTPAGNEIVHQLVAIAVIKSHGERNAFSYEDKCAELINDSTPKYGYRMLFLL